MNAPVQPYRTDHPETVRPGDVQISRLEYAELRRDAREKGNEPGSSICLVKIHPRGRPTLHGLGPG